MYLFTAEVQKVVKRKIMIIHLLYSLMINKVFIVAACLVSLFIN